MFPLLASLIRLLLYFDQAPIGLVFILETGLTGLSTHVRFISGSGLSEVHHYFKDFVQHVASEQVHHMVQKLVGGVHLVTSADNTVWSHEGHVIKSCDTNIVVRMYDGILSDHFPVIMHI